MFFFGFGLCSHVKIKYMADGAPQRLAELWYGVEVSATDSTRRSLPPLVSKSYCLTSLAPEKQLMTRTLHS
jgi:hypothetical protein